MRIFLTIMVMLLLVGTCSAAETRKVSVVARDSKTGSKAEVKLYNKTFAVVIGIDKYPNLPPEKELTYAVQDAKGVAKVLKDRYRFDRIVPLYNEEATREKIIRLLTHDLSEMDMGPDDSLFIFWAGHGNQISTPDGDIGYLIPYDAVADNMSTTSTMTDIRETISKMIPAKHVFYAMDACYSGLLTEPTRANKKIKSQRDLNYMKEITRERVRQVLTAGKKGEEVLDGGPKGHSVFAGRLIEALEIEQDFITANELSVKLRERVFSDAQTRNHRQTPAFGKLYGLGDFVFIPKQPEVKAILPSSLTDQQPAPVVGRSLFRDPFTGMEFVPVKGGCFQMGDTFGDGQENEKPVHEVCISDFAIGRYEVTQGQWQKVMGSNPSMFKECGGDCPVEHLGWDYAQEFIRKLNSQTERHYRLPTEAEWEYACRSGGKDQKYCGGNKVDDVAWYYSNSGGEPHPVGQKQPNDLGIYDMSGNVVEWVNDWYGKDYYEGSQRNNPQGPTSGDYRHVRGGDCYSEPADVRASIRDNGPGLSHLGFRLVAPVQ